MENKKILMERVRLEIARKEKAKVALFEKTIREEYASGKIDKKKFDEAYSKGHNGKPIDFWHSYYDSCINNYLKNIKRYEKKINLIGLSILSIFLIAVFFSFTSEPITKITGKVIEEDSSESVQDSSIEQEAIGEEPAIGEVTPEINEGGTEETPLEEMPLLEEDSSPSEVEEAGNETQVDLEVEETNESEIYDSTNDSLINPLEGDNQTESNFTIAEVIENETLSEGLNNLSLVNESLMNETIIVENLTIGDANITTVQYGAVLGKPVRWKKIVELETAGGVIVPIPEIAENVNVTKIENLDEGLNEEITEAITEESIEDLEEDSNEEIISPAEFTITGNVVSGATLAGDSRIISFIKNFFRKLSTSFTGRVIEGEMAQEAVEKEMTHIELEIIDNATTYEVEYETPAPYAIESDMERGKKVEIIGVDGLHYENVLAFTELPENLNLKSKEKVRIYWKENDTYLYPTLVEDIDLNGIYDYIEWIAPHLSNQTFEIILITKAERLNENKTFVEDIYDYVRALDGNWTKVNDSQYVRVTFEIPLDSTRDITLYARSNYSNSSVEVYEFNSTNKVADFGEISEEKYHKIYLTNITNTSDVFDLKILGEIEFDLIIDPWVDNGSLVQYITDCNTLNTTNAIYYLQNNVSSNGTCFSITAHNITLDGQGYWVNYSIDGNLGYGILTSVVNYTTIRNLTINEGAGSTFSKHGIYLNNSNYSSLSYFHTRTGAAQSSLGVYVGASNYNNFSNFSQYISVGSFRGGIYVEGQNNQLNNFSLDHRGDHDPGITVDHDNNIVNNFTIETSSNVAGVSVTNNAQGNLLSNFTIISSGSSSWGVYVRGPGSYDNNNFNNFNITGYGDTSTGLYVGPYSAYNNYSNFNINMNGSNSNGIYLRVYEANILNNSNIAMTGINSSGIYIDVNFSGYVTTGTQFINMNITTNNNYSIYDLSGSAGSNHLMYTNNFGTINFTNSSFLQNLTVIGNLTYPGNIRIENNSAYLNSSALAVNGSLINSSAINITLQGINFSGSSGLKILNNEVPCGSNCYNFTALNATTVIFNVSGLGSYSIGVVLPGLNVWNCTASGLWSNSSCWTARRIPVDGDYIIFNGTGTGNVNVTNNTMPQDLANFTVSPSYTGTMNFFPLFAVGNWTGRNDGTQAWNVSGNINISGGTIKVWGDYRLNDTYSGVFGNITREGHGQIWRSLSGNITVGSGAVIDGVGLGFSVDSGPAYSTFGGGSHGGIGVYGSNNLYGNASAPTSLGSGGGNVVSERVGSSAIKLHANQLINVAGRINMSGPNVDYNPGAGGSIWLKADNISGTGMLSANGGNSLNNYAGGGGGRIRLEYGANMSFGGSISVDAGSGGLDAGAGTLTFTNNTWPGDWNLTGNIGLLGGNYGEGNVTNVRGSFNTNGYNLTIYGDCFYNSTNSVMCYNNTMEGRGVWINASGEILISQGSIIDGTGLGFPPSFGPGYYPGGWSGASYGGVGGYYPGFGVAPVYGNESEPLSLGSGSHGYGAGGSAIKLESVGNITLNGSIIMSGYSDSRGGSGGSILVMGGGNITGRGLLDASGANGSGVSWSVGGGGGRISIISNGTISFNGTINSLGGLDDYDNSSIGSGGTIYINASNYISLSGNISVIGANGTLGSGQRINLSSSVINLSGVYNASIYNLSVAGTSKGNISLSYTSCLTNYSSALFDPSAFVSSYPDCIAPNMSFVSPTESNGTLISRNFVYTNVSASDDRGNVSTFVNFDNSLVGWWRMDDYNSTHVFDYFGNYNGTMNGTTIESSGKIGKSINHDNGESISIMDGWNRTYDNSTFAIWFKHSNSSNQDFHLVSTSEGYGDQAVYIRFYIAGAGSKKLSCHGFANEEEIPSISDGNWHQVVCTRDSGTGNVSLYYDGNLVDTEIGTTGSWNGLNNHLGISGYNTMSLDDLIIFNRSLGAQEISALYADSSLKYLQNNYTSLSNGNHTFKAYSQDSSGNVNSTEERTIFIDATVPELSFVSPTPENTSKLNLNSIYVNTSSSDSLGNVSTFIDLDNSLVSWWRMDDYNSTHVFDYMGRNNATIELNYTSNSSGKIGRSFSTVGNGGFLKVSDSNSLDLSTQGTISAWYLMKYPNRPALVEKLPNCGENCATGSYSLGFALDTNRPYFAIYGNSTSIAATSSSDLGLNEWHHVVGIWNSTQIYLFIDGALINSTTNNITHLNASTGSLLLGAIRESGPETRAINGSLDDIMIFNRSLTGAEVVALYANTSSKYLQNNFTNLSEGSHTFRAYSQDSAGNVNSTSIRQVSIDTILPTTNFVNPTPSNGELLPRTYSFINVSSSDSAGNVSTFVNFDNSLVGWWRMDDYNSTHVFDYTGRNNGTIIGGAAISSVGKIGKALSFDSVDDELDIPDHSSLDIYNLTLSAWVYTVQTGEQNIIDKRAGGPYDGYQLRLEGGGPNLSIDFVIRDGSGIDEGDGTAETKLIAANAVSQNNWSHIVGVYDQDGNEIKIYFNGVLVANRTSLRNTTSGPSSLSIGSFGESAYDFNGSIDDVMIFNRSLSGAEVQGLYANTSSKYLQNNFTSLTDGVHTYKVYTQDSHGNINYTEERNFEVVSPGLNVWNCTISSLWSNSSCWTGRRIPVAGDYIVFNGTGTGNVNVTNNTMPQDLINFTVTSGYTGTINFFPLFAVGNWTGRDDGTQMWNVTGDINLSGGTVRVWGDYRLNDTYPGVFGNITREGHGQIWKSLSGNITVGSGAVIDGFTLGFSSFTGPVAGQLWNCGGGHGGLGCSRNIYGNASAPTSLGSGATYGGGSAIKLESIGFVNVLGQINMSGFGVGPDGSAGGSIWIKSNNISLSGRLLASAGSGWGYSGGGRIRLEYGQNLTSTANISVSGSNNNGGDYISRAAGTLTFTNNTWPGDWNLTGNVGLLGGNYGEGNVTNVRGSFNTNGYNLTIYGDCFYNFTNPVTCYNQTTEGRGVWINASGNITVSSNSIIYGDSLGFEAIGPGTSGSYGSGHGGKGGGIPQAATIYGNFTHPISLGSGLWENTYGGSAVKLESLNDISLEGRVTVTADTGSSGGSILVIGRRVTGVGILNAFGGIGSNEAGGGGRVAIISSQLTNFSGRINVSGGLPGNPAAPRFGSGGTVYLSSSETIYLYSNLSTVGINGSSSGGQVNITAPSLFILSGIYNVSRINLSDNNFNGVLSINYSNCSSDISGGTFDPENPDVPDCETPEIQIVFPTQSTYYNNASGDITRINFTVYDENLQTCKYSLNNGTTNFTTSCSSNITGLSSNPGWNIWTVYANDTGDQRGYALENRSVVTFYKDLVLPIVSNLSGMPSNNSVGGALTTFNFTATDDLDSNLTCYPTYSGSVENGTNVVYLSNGSSTSVQRILNGGPHTINITCYDEANNSHQSVGINYLVAVINVTSPTNNQIARIGTSNDFVVEEIEGEDFLNTASVFILNSSGTTLNIINTTGDPEHSGSYNWSGLSPQYITARISVYNSSTGITQNVSEERNLILLRAAGNTTSPEIENACTNETYVANNTDVSISFISDLDTLILRENITIISPNNQAYRLANITYSVDNQNYSYIYNYTFRVNQTGQYLLMANVTDYENQSDSWNYTFYSSADYADYTVNSSIATFYKIDDCLLEVDESGSSLVFRIIDSQLTNINVTIPDTLHNLTLSLVGVNLTENVNEAIGYTEMTDEIDAPNGTRRISLFELNTSLNITNYTLTYDYSPIAHTINNESTMKVYKCSNLSDCDLEEVGVTADEGNNSLTLLGNTFSYFLIVENSSGATVTQVISSGGGTRTKTVYRNLKIITPGPIKLGLKDEIVIPIVLSNPEEIDLEEIKLNASSNTLDISPYFEETEIDSLDAGENKTVMLFLESHSTPGEYEVRINATVGDPLFEEEAVIFVRLAEVESFTQEEIIERINVAQKLFLEDPRCLELNDLLERAKALSEEGNYEDSLTLVSQVIRECRELITGTEFPTTIEDNRESWMLPVMVALILLIALLIGFELFSRPKTDPNMHVPRYMKVPGENFSDRKGNKKISWFSKNKGIKKSVHKARKEKRKWKNPFN